MMFIFMHVHFFQKCIAIAGARPTDSSDCANVDEFWRISLHL